MQMQLSPLWWCRSPRKHITAACFVLVFLEAVTKARDMSPCPNLQRARTPNQTHNRSSPSSCRLVPLMIYDHAYSYDPRQTNAFTFSSTIVYHIYYSHVTLSSPKFRTETYLHRILQHNINLLTLDSLKVHERDLSSLNTTL